MGRVGLSKFLSSKINTLLSILIILLVDFIMVVCMLCLIALLKLVVTFLFGDVDIVVVIFEIAHRGALVIFYIIMVIYDIIQLIKIKRDD